MGWDRAHETHKSTDGRSLSDQIKKRPRSVLFICTSNVCRGPMAAALFKRRSPDDSSRIVRSAGIDGVDGRPVLAPAQAAVHKRGVDLSHHLARIATPHLLPAFDLVLAMERRQQEWVARYAPAALDRTWLLGHWRDVEIQRPVNGHHPDYDRIADTIDQCLVDWVRRIEVLDDRAGSPDVSPRTDSTSAY